MRLIDADTIKTIDYSGLTYIAPNDYQGIANYFYEQLIKNQPTAYDVDKVVKQLERVVSIPTTGAEFINKQVAIEIVKGAVKDE